MGYIYYDDWYDDFLAHAEVTRTDDMKYGLPEQKKYPMPDRKHVMSAIKFFNYVSPKDEETLAHAILARMKEYGIDEVNVGPDNRFGKYYKPDTIAHHQIKGAKHGIRRWQNEDGSWTPAGRLRYGKGGAPRGSYKDNDKTSYGERAAAADYDGDTLIELKGGRGALALGPDAFKTKKEYLEAITKDCLYDPANLKEHENDPEMKKRVIGAADLGLKAIENLRGPGYVDWEYEPNPEPHREWFIFEDQTIGMHMVADLINQGYTSKEVKKLIDELDANYDYNTAMSGESAMTNAMFQVREGYQLKEFAEECEKVKKDITSKNLPPINYDGDNFRTIDISDPSKLSKEDKQFLREIGYLDKNNLLKNIDDFNPKNTQFLPPADFDGDDVIMLPPPSETERRLDKTQEKLERLEKEKESSSYKKREDRKKEIERQLESLHKKTQKIRDNKLFKDKDPGFFARMNLKKEKRLEKELAKINTGFREHERAIEKLNIKKEKYEKKIEKDFKYDAATREAMRLARNDGYDSLTEAQKKLIREVAAQYVDSI